jgi:hypothetical protein
VAGGKKKHRNKSIFGSIRKPTAPPSRKIGDEKPEERIHPSERKSKHKKKIEPEEA